MGNINSTILCEEEIEAIKNTTVFETAEIEHLFERFLYLDKLNLGYLTYNELNNIPEFEINPFNKLIINVLEKRMDYENISFLSFLNFLEIFHIKTEKSTRIQFLFDIFDLHRDGRLCKSVLTRISSLMGVNDSREVEYVLEIFDRNKKGYLDYEDFKVFYDSDSSIEKNMGAKENSTESIDDLETLVLRLETSSYTEDKLDTLRLIYEYSLMDPISTGSYSLNIIFETLNDLEDISYNLKIILEVLQSSHAMEFTDLILKNESYLGNLIEAHEKNPAMVYKILSIMSKNYNCKKKLICCKNISFLLVKELGNDRFEVLKNILVLKGNFKKQLIFEGIFEKLLGKLINFKGWVFDLLELLLQDNHFNQNYFIETDWTIILNYLDSNTQIVFNLLNILLDKTNNNFKYIKQNVIKFVDLKKCVAKEQYELISSFIYNDVTLFNQFLTIYNQMSLGEIVTDKDQCNMNESDTGLVVLYYILKNNIIKFNINSEKQYNSALKLLSEILIYNSKHLIAMANRIVVQNNTKTDLREEIRKFNEKFSLVFDISIILSIREIVCDFKIHEIPIDTHFALFILFNYDSEKVKPFTSHLLEIIYEDTSDKDLVSLCILICLIHDIRLGFNNAFYLHQLKYLRKFISLIDINSKIYLIEDCVFIILDKINELIVKYSEPPLLDVQSNLNDTDQ